MKKTLLAIVLLSVGLLFGCKQQKSDVQLVFAVSAEYPPFEYQVRGELQGFDIDLARLVAKEMGKEAVFKNMQFSVILPALQAGSVDAAISTITITDARKQQFDFSESYYVDSIAMVYPTNKPITSEAQIANKKIACQLGTTMEIWLRKHFPDIEIVTMDSNNQSIEALKAGHVDGVLLDGVQAIAFSQKNPGLSWAVIGKANTGYGIAFKKGSLLRTEVNAALKRLEERGEMKKLEEKWLKG